MSNNHRPTEPWNISPKLTRDRLQLIAGEVVRVRAEAALEHRPEVGDDSWSFGCRAYRRTCFALAALSSTGDHPWLTIREDGLAFQILVEGEPLRFYCGDAEKPSARSLRRGIGDLVDQGRFSFYDDELAASDEGWFWLLAIEPAEEGTVLRIVVLQANPEGEVRNQWEIPVNASIQALGLVSSIQRHPVELPPPAIGPKSREMRTALNGTRGRSDGNRG